MAETIIDIVYGDNKALVDYLQQQNEISLRAVADSALTKTLVLAAASFYETMIKDALLEFATEFAGRATPLVEFLKNKAIERQYHTFFQWDRSNANQFFALFGPGFADYMRREIAASDNLQESIAAFMELGDLRNRLTHQNFAAFVIDKTAVEVYELHKLAISFVDGFPRTLRAYRGQSSGGAR